MPDLPEAIPLFDSHLHIINPRFPLVENQGYLPDAFSVEQYLNRLKPYRLMGGAVVSGSFQQFDQTYLTDALAKLGKTFVGVTQLPSSSLDSQILQLNSQGVRALRFNLRRGGSEHISRLKSFASRVFELAGWHIELYMDAGQLPDIYPVIRNLPAVSIDHLGLRQVGLQYLLRAADEGIRVKATGFGRVDFAIQTALESLYRANPEALMFGTDLPSTRAPRPFRDHDITTIIETLGETAAEDVLYRNALKFYRLD